MNHGINWKKREENLRALAAFYRKTYEGAVAAGRDDGGWVAIPSADRSRVAPGRMLARLDGLLVGSGFMFAPKAARNGAVRLVDGDESRWLNHAVPASCKAFCLPSEPPADWCEDAMAAWRSAERRAAAGVSADASESVVAGSPPSSECVRPSRPPTRHQAAMAERWRAQRFKSVADAARSLTSPLPFDERLAGQYRHLRFDRAAWDIAKSSYHPDRPEDAANYEADLSKHARPDGSFRAQRKGNRVFHPFHSCPKALRKRLWSFDGEPVAEAWDMSSGAVRCMLEVVAGETPENERAFLLGILRDPSRKLYREIAAEAGLGEGSAADVKTALLAFIHATPAGYRRFAVGGGRHGFRLPDGRWSERRDRAGMERRRRGGVLPLPRAPHRRGVAVVWDDGREGRRGQMGAADLPRKALLPLRMDGRGMGVHEPRGPIRHRSRCALLDAPRCPMVQGVRPRPSAGLVGGRRPDWTSQM